MPYVWPLKLAMPLTGFLLFIQGISETLKSFLAAVKGVTFGEEAEKVEI
jgi:TRAP-type mannitol/chloroaromatic compound transport system permease small subunit